MPAISRPMTEADRDERAKLLVFTSRGEVKRDQAAVICDREYREALGHAGMDEAGEWAVANSRTLRAGVADARMYQLAEQENARKVAESVKHMAECGGYSFCQGAQPCYPHCAEMACAEPDDKPSLWLRFCDWLDGLMWEALTRDLSGPGCLVALIALVGVWLSMGWIAFAISR